MKNTAYLKSAVAVLCLSALLGCESGIARFHAAGPTGVTNILLVHGAWSDGSGGRKSFLYFKPMATMLLLFSSR